MKKFLLSLLALLPLTLLAQTAPLYIRATNGVVFPLTPTSVAQTVNSNGYFIVQCRTNPAAAVNKTSTFMDWKFGTDIDGVNYGGFATVPVEGGLTFGLGASVYWQHRVHGTLRGALSLNGGPDLLMQEGLQPNPIYGGFIQIGSHANYSGEIEIAYAGGAPNPGDLGHGKPVGYAAIYNNSGSALYSKYTELARPGTVEINGSGYGSGYLEMYDVPPFWDNVNFSVAPNVAAGRKIGRRGAEGYIMTLAGAQASFGGYTNSGLGGTLGHRWIATNGIPGQTAADGSIATSTAGNGTVYVRNNGAWVALGASSGDSFWGIAPASNPTGGDLLAPVSVGDSPAVAWVGTSGTTNLNIASGSTFRLYEDGALQVIIDANTFTLQTGSFDQTGENLFKTAANTVTFSKFTGTGTSVATIDATGNLGRGQPIDGSVVFSKTITGVNLTATESPTLITVPAGKIFIMTSAAVYVTADENITVPAQVIIDASGNQMSVSADGILTGMVTGDVATIRPLALTGKPGSFGDVVRASITGGTADSYTGTIIVTGYYIDAP